MQKRPKAQSSLAQSPLIYVIPVQTGIQFFELFLRFSLASLQAKHNEPNKLNKIFLNSTTSIDFYGPQ